MINASKMSNESRNYDVEEFMRRPLMTWFRSCLELINKENCTYEELVDGVLVHQVFLQMGLQLVDDSEVLPSQEDVRHRAHNLRLVLANLRHFYEEEGPVVLPAPRVARLAREPRHHVLDAELLLCLLLGCAVQCRNKEAFIDRIKQLDVPTQQAIAECIRKVVHVEEPEGEANIERAFEHARQIYGEREKTESRLDDEEELQEVVRRPDTELHECRAQMRRQRDELKETYEELHDCREELRQCMERGAKIQKENEILVTEARSAKSYRDELDAAMERAEKTDRLEQEIARYKEKLADVEFLKSRLIELQDINQLLVESKEKLDEELAAYKARAGRALDLEKRCAELQRRNDELTLENEEARKRQNELIVENEELNTLLKVSTKEALDSGFSIDPEESSASLNSSLSEQLSNSAQSQALKLELENRRLSSLVDSLKESSSRGSHSKFLELEQENRRLAITMDSLRGELERYRAAPQQQQEPRSPLRPTDLERRCSELSREKHRLQSLLERVQRRSLELERSLNEARRRLEQDPVTELRVRVDQLEAEKRAARCEVREAVGRAQAFERLLAEARASQTTVRRAAPSGQELTQLQEDFGRLYREYQRLHARLAELEAELGTKNRRVVEYDRKVDQLKLRCADLAREKSGLLEHANQLVQHYSDLFAQTLEDKEHYYEEERKNREKVNHLCRQKEKLEEKIMDHYRRMEPSSAGKKRSIGTNLVKNTLFKMRRASSGLFNRSRRSWAEESSEKSYDFDFTRGHESDGANEPRNRKSVDFLDNFRPSEFSFQVNLEERSRKSVDFMDMVCSEECEKTDDDDELDRTLHDESKNEEDLSLFGKNKSVDLSLEDLLEEPEHEVPDKRSVAREKAIKSDKSLQQARSRKSVWIEQGCV